MKRIPDREWFTTTGVCAVVGISEATLNRMLARDEFPPEEARQGQRRLWSFTTLADYCTGILLKEQRRLYKLLDEIERLSELRKRRLGSRERAAENEAALERIRQAGMDAEGLEDYVNLGGMLNPEGELARVRALFPVINPEEILCEATSDIEMSDQRRRLLSQWRASSLSQ